MGIWKGQSLLVIHKCGCKLWLRWEGEAPAWNQYQQIGGQLWLGDQIYQCECGAELTPFRSKEFGEA